VRLARDSGQVTQEDEEQRPATECSQPDSVAIGLHEGQVSRQIADLQAHGSISFCDPDYSVDGAIRVVHPYGQW
jgi:hypothetical protein